MRLDDTARYSARGYLRNAQRQGVRELQLPRATLDRRQSWHNIDSESGYGRPTGFFHHVRKAKELLPDIYILIPPPSPYGGKLGRDTSVPEEILKLASVSLDYRELWPIIMVKKHFAIDRDSFYQAIMILTFAAPYD